MRVAKGSSVTITSEPFDAAPETPTCTVVRADGTEITPAPTCGVDEAEATVTVPLTAADHLDELDQLTVTITSGDEVQVIDVDVIGSNWVSIASLRKDRNSATSRRSPTRCSAKCATSGSRGSKSCATFA